MSPVITPITCFARSTLRTWATGSAPVVPRSGER
ncbi:hypothetical protein ACVWWR_008529 [Bradyrhizobium sp. LM3.2]